MEGHPREDLGRYELPRCGTLLRPGPAGGGALMPNRLRQLSDAGRQRDFQDGAARSDREKRYANTSQEYEAFRKRTCEATENERSKLYISLMQHPYFTS